MTTAVLTALTGALLVVAVTPGSAEAVTRTSTGQACTIVGTKGRDVLKGTKRRDVICGRGGNDVINGRGGNDVIDGGAGHDRLSGSTGNDVLLGGAGGDRLDGAAGNDKMTGGTGNDRIAGGAGNDRVDAGSGNDSVNGGDGRDVANGGTGNDALSGAAGDDDLQGGTGADRLSGGAGADDGAGGAGNDVVRGDVGDDELSGGAGSDDVDGGAGFNLCDVVSEAADRQVRCATDTSRPVLRELRLSRTTVDVSNDDQVIEVRARVTDDTGVRSVQIGNSATRVSGTARDGVWATVIRVPRFIAPGPRDVDVFATDRVGRDGSETRPAAYRVVNSVVDTAMPVVRSVRLSASSLDVRSSEKSITASVRVTDDLAGATDVYLCPSHAFPTGVPNFRQDGGCATMEQASGTRRDSTWTGTLDVPRGAPSGTWNTDVWISDASGNSANDFWYGPDAYAAQETLGQLDPRTRALPGGAGVFTVRGATPDTHAPVLTSMRMSPSTVDTSDGAKRVTVQLAGTDVEGITGAFVFVSGRPADQSGEVQIAWVTEFARVSGTARNGVWRATFDVPGGTPDGTYFIQTGFQDRSHFESWVSADSGWTTDNHVLTSALAPTGTHLVVANTP